MPFDPVGFRQPKVTVLPPTLRALGHDVRLPPVVPERRGGEPPRRVHIVIEVRLPAPPRHRPRTAFWWWAVALTMIALAAHAQPTEWRSYPFGSGTNYTGTDAQGREWTGRSYDLGGVTYFDAAGPDGRHVHCQSSTLGSDTTTRCWPDRQ
jgi:hypothetical protein